MSFQISGTLPCIENAKQAILEKCKILEAERQDRALKSFGLKVIKSYFHSINFQSNSNLC